MEAVTAGDLEGLCRLTKEKILIVGAFPPPELKVFGGIVTSCRALLNSSFSTRFDLILVDSTQISNPPPPFVTRAILALRRFLSFCYKTVETRPDAVILFASSGISLLEKGAMAWFSRFLHVPVLLFPRGGRLMDMAAASKFHNFWIRCSLKGADYFLCQGPAWHRFAIDIVQFAPSRAPTVPNWTATNALLAIGSARGTRKQNDIVKLLFLGWLEKEKGIFELLHACCELAHSYNFELVIAGRGHAEAGAKLLVSTSGLAGRVRFAGWVQGRELEQLLAESDVLVLPSWAEGLPNSMIEAMAAGLAVVVSSVGNVPDVVTNGCEALLVPAKDVESLRYALQRVLGDPELRGLIAARGHAFARKNYAVETAVHVLSESVMTAIKSRA